MIARIAVDVVEHESKRRTTPIRQATFGAMALQEAFRQQSSLQRRNGRVSTVRHEDDVERKAGRPVVTLAPEVSSSKEMTRVEPQARDGALNGLVVRAGSVETQSLQDGAH